MFQSLSPASQDVEEALRRRQRSTTVEEKEEQLRRGAQELLEGERSRGGGARCRTALADRLAPGEGGQMVCRCGKLDRLESANDPLRPLAQFSTLTASVVFVQPTELSLKLVQFSLN